MSHTFPTKCTLFCVTSQNLNKQTIFNTNTHFTISTTYAEFQTSTTIVPQGNLTADCEIKQHIWRWKDKENCSSSAVCYVIIWMTAETTQNETQLYHCTVIIIWHNPIAPWHACLILTRLLKLSCQKLGTAFSLQYNWWPHSVVSPAHK
jgi:hypothetical protein